MIVLVYGVLSAGVLVWYSMVVGGLDLETTIDISTSLSHYIIGWTSVVFGGFAFGACLLSKNNNQILANLREQNRAAWIFSASLYASIMTAACVWTTGRLVRTVAQHLPGFVHESRASVMEVWRRGAGRPGCVEEIRVNFLNKADHATICVEMRWGDRISPDTLAPADQVRIRLRDTRLGVVVERIERADARS